jgi:two-component system sensor histidine kinase EvgS
MNVVFRIVTALMIVLMGCFSLMPLPVQARTVRVGWYLLDGMQEYDVATGLYGGYNFEYLRTIAQYTDWDYEFVILPFDDCLKQLAEGKLDIVGNLTKTPERDQQLLFPANHEGVAAPRIVTLAENSQYGYEDFSAFDGMRVGMYESGNLTQSLSQYAADHQFQVQPVIYNQHMFNDLREGNIDAVITISTQRVPGMRIIAQLPQQKIYFVTSRDKQWVRDGLDYAISQIKFYDANFDEHLFEKNYTENNDAVMAFTKEESAYLDQRIADGKPVIVAYDSAWMPLEYKNGSPQSMGGIMRAVFDIISKRTGLQFTYVTAANFEELKQLYQDRAEIYASLVYDLDWGSSLHMYLTQPVFDMQIYMVSVPGTTHLDTIAVPSGYHITQELLKRYGGRASDNTFIYYDTVEDCINAVCNHDVSRTYINEFELNYYVGQLSRKQLNMQAVAGFTEPLSIAVSKQADPLLASIISRSLSSIPHSDIREIVKNNTHRATEPAMIDLVYANPLKALILVSLFLLFSCGTLFFAYSNRKNKQQRQALEIANMAKGNFLSRMSHDIRTPMNAIMGMTVLAGRENRSAKVADYLDKIGTSSQFLMQLLNDILDMSMIEQGTITLHPGPYDLKEFSEFIKSSIATQVKAKHIRFIYEVDPALRGVIVDSLRFKQIFMNLLSNAVKFTPAGGTITFSMRVQSCSGKDVTICGKVRDTGIGMSREFLTHLFEPFTQEGKQHVKTTEGSGLGLAIVRRFIDTLGGTIDVVSEKGQGTEFTVTLTLPTCAITEQSGQADIFSGIFLEDVRVLVVEDNEINQVITCQILESAGVTCEVAHHGLEAVQRVVNSTEYWFDLILMDIRMPVMDGIEATRRLRKLDREDVKTIPIVALTADAYNEQKQAIMDSGMTGYLTKPVQPRELLQALRDILDTSQHV